MPSLVLHFRGMGVGFCARVGGKNVLHLWSRRGDVVFSPTKTIRAAAIDGTNPRPHPSGLTSSIVLQVGGLVPVKLPMLC